MRRQSRSAYYVPRADREGVHLGLDCLMHTSRELPAGEAWLVTPSHYSLRGVVQEVLGEPAVTALLLKNDTATLQGRLPFRHYTEETLPYIGANCVILAISPTQRLLDRLDTLNGVIAITVVSEDQERMQPWILRWQAIQAVRASDDPA